MHEFRIQHVYFMGFQNQTELPQFYAIADVFVLPSSFDPWGLVVNEAMCCGCPVIASDHVGAARDLVAPVAPDFVFRCGDMDSLANLLRKAAAGAGRLKELGRAAMTHIQTWSPERNIAATVEAIRIAVNRTGRRRPAELDDPAASRSSPATTTKFRE